MKLCVRIFFTKDRILVPAKVILPVGTQFMIHIVLMHFFPQSFVLRGFIVLALPIGGIMESHARWG